MKQQSSVDIIGLGCRYPGGIHSPDQLWQALQSRQSLIGPPPAGRWRRQAAVAAGHAKGKSVTDRAGWLPEVEAFDAGYFHLSPNETGELDPQQRLALEVSIEAIVDANLAPKSLAGRRVGVFVGAGMAEQLGRMFADPDSMGTHSMTGGALSIIANRISYFLDLSGPSLTVDTACSSALTALYVAHRSLEAGDCDLALVVGVNVLMTDSPFIGFSQAHMLSPRGVSAPFDESADGFVRAEGCGACLLEPSGRAPAGSRRVYAQLIGSGANEDGRTPSMTMPSASRQRELMQRVAEQAGISPSSVSFVEAHGTGTAVGDPIEASSIAAVFAGDRATPLSIGSIKGHLGHMETAAGLAGLTKAALCVYHRQLVPTAGHSQLSRKIDAASLNVRVAVAVEPLRQAEPVIGGVSAYGFGGANTFALLREAAAESPPASKQRPPSTLSLAFSAHTAESLAQLTSRAEALPEGELLDAAAWWSQVHGGERHRQVLLGEPGPEFAAKAERVAGVAPDVAPRVLFAFGGQGSHAARMGTQLYAEIPAYRELIGELDRAYQRASGVSLVAEHGFCRAELAPALLENVALTLPCIVLSQVALVKLLERLGVRPSAVVGHSTGEMVAAWCAGALSLEELCLLTHERASHQARMRKGAMAALAVDQASAQALIDELGHAAELCIAGVNALEAVTLAGDEPAIERLVALAKSRGLRATQLDIPRAYHSHHVAEIVGSLSERLATLTSRDGHLPFVSSVAGQSGLRVGSELGGRYWLANIESPVHFWQACEAAQGLAELVLEVSPRPVLAPYLSANLPSRSVLSALPRKTSEYVGLQRALASLYVAGIDVDWRALLPARGFVAVPPIPWDHSKPALPNPLRERNLSQARRTTGSALVLRRDEQAFLADHQVAGRPVLPGAAYVTRAMAQLGLSSLTDVAFKKFLPLWTEGETTELSLEAGAAGGQWTSQAGVHMTFRRAAATEPPPPPPPLDSAEQLRARCSGELDMRRVYSSLDSVSGLRLSGAFQSLSGGRVGDAEAVADVTLPTGLELADAQAVALDACFQLLGIIAGLDSDFWAPTAAKRVAFFGQIPVQGSYCHAVLKAIDARRVVGELTLYDAAGRVLLTVDGFTMTKVPSSADGVSLLAVDWQALGVPRAERPPADADVESALRQLLGLSARRVLRVLDLTGKLLTKALSTLPPGATAPLLYGVALGSASETPGVRSVATLAELEGKSFDVVIGDGAECFLTPGGVLLAGGWSAPTSLPPAATALRWASFGDYVPGFGVPSSLSEAELVVDSRDSLLEASALLRSVPRTSRVVFITRFADGRLPSGALGLARAARSEEGRDVRVLGVPSELSVHEARRYIDPLLEHGFGGEAEIYLKDGHLVVPRLVPAAAPPPPPAGPERRLEVAVPGQLSSLLWRPIAVEQEGLGAKEVRVRVHEVALHFKDVMLAMGLLPGFEPVLGLECSGTIVELGEEVRTLHPELTVGQTVACCRLTEARR
jgi:acyl transferase domain-containing protein